MSEVLSSHTCDRDGVLYPQTCRECCEVLRVRLRDLEAPAVRARHTLQILSRLAFWMRLEAMAQSEVSRSLHTAWYGSADPLHALITRVRFCVFASQLYMYAERPVVRLSWPEVSR